MLKSAIVSLCAAALIGCASNTAEAYTHPGATGWVLNPNLCPDLIEDRQERRAARRDERVVTSRRDLREDRRQRRQMARDEAVTVCPAKAWRWAGVRSTRVVPRPAAAAIYYNARDDRYYFRNGRKAVIVRF